VHLTCCPYGPEEAPSGKGPRRVLALERSLRLPEIKPQLGALGPVSRRGTPTFLTGDFNSPSHLDWTEPVHLARPERVPFALDWPVSRALARAGWHDSYREAHPDPVANPGYTWTPGTPPPRIRRKETLDRIDWVMAAGPARTLASRPGAHAREPARRRRGRAGRRRRARPLRVGPPRGRLHVRGHSGARARARERRAARRHAR
jgi:hypothetical protein